MKTRSWLFGLAAAVAAQADVYALIPPSESDGPIRLLTCVVDPRGILEAQVDNRTEDDMNCNIRCNYELGEKTFTHSFNVTIRGRFQGRIGEFDTGNGKAGNYSGDIGTCKKVSR
ncbi:MAG: hypothetical protein ABI821_04235 [Pseudomonadota bacterium]